MFKLLRSFHSNLHKFMIFPALILFSVFFIYPLFNGIGLSLTDWNGISRDYNYVGLQNFIDFFSDGRAITGMKNTLQFGFCSALLLNVFGLLYALILDSKIKGKNVTRAVVYSPAIISPLIMGYVWLLILKPESGVLHQVMKAFQAGDAFYDSLGDIHTAMWTIIAINVWQFVGISMIIYLAGLQAIPQEVYESCRIDGAGYMQTLRYITMPLLAPSVRTNVIINIIGSLGVFDVIMALTQGGPGYATESLSIFIMRMCYGGQTGYSTAVAVIMFFIVLVPVAVSMQLMKSKDVEM